jgi:hypothetical protein
MLKSVSQCSRYAICFAAVIVSSSPGFAQTLGSRQGPAAFEGGETHEIRGITRDGDRQPVPGARALVHGYGFRDRIVTADADGAFSVLDLSASVYELRPSKVGFSEAPRTLVEIGDASSVNVELALDHGPSAPQARQSTDQEPPRRAPGIVPSSELFGSTIGGRPPAAALLKPIESSCERGL